MHELCSFAVTVVEGGDKALEGEVDFASFVDAAFTEALEEDVVGDPVHTEGGVAAFVGSVHGADGVVGLFYLTLLAQVKYIFYGHFSIERKPLRGIEENQQCGAGGGRVKLFFYVMCQIRM